MASYRFETNFPKAGLKIYIIFYCSVARLCIIIVANKTNNVFFRNTPFTVLATYIVYYDIYNIMLCLKSVTQANKLKHVCWALQSPYNSNAIDSV